MAKYLRSKGQGKWSQIWADEQSDRCHSWIPYRLLKWSIMVLLSFVLSKWAWSCLSSVGSNFPTVFGGRFQFLHSTSSVITVLRRFQTVLSKWFLNSEGSWWEGVKSTQSVAWGRWFYYLNRNSDLFSGLRLESSTFVLSYLSSPITFYSQTVFHYATKLPRWNSNHKVEIILLNVLRLLKSHYGSTLPVSEPFY